MNRQEKSEEVSKIQGLLDGAQLVILTEYAGLDVSSMVELRQELRKAQGSYRIVKNTLAKIATADTDMSALHPHFSGPVAMAWTKEDPAGIAKALVEFKKKHPEIELKAAYLKGSDLLDETGIVALSKLPGKDELRGMFLSTLAGVSRKMVTLLSQPARSFAGVLEARRRQLAGED